MFNKEDIVFQEWSASGCSIYADTNGEIHLLKLIPKNQKGFLAMFRKALLNCLAKPNSADSGLGD
jgi:hypothetical protein